VKTKRWSRTAFRDELKTKFGHLLADEEGISLREARHDIGALSREQLEQIYESAKARMAGDEEERAEIPFCAVVDEVEVHDLLPTLAWNAAAARRKV